jgi:hypothetical protein
MALPTFLVIGAMKAGTTSLHELLGRHPDVFMSNRKELHYFSVAENYERGRGWYESYFADGAEMPARGEASPSYSQADIFPGVPERISELLPDVRLVYVVREPIERLRSMYLHQLANGRETRPLAEAVLEEPYFVNSSRYSWQLDHHLEYVPAGRIHVLTIDQLLDDPADALSRLHDFLGVTPIADSRADVHRGRTEDKRVATPLRSAASSVPGYRQIVAALPDSVRRFGRRATTRPVDRSMAEVPDGLREELIERLRPDLVGLRRFLGDDFDGWGHLAVD